MDCMDLANLKPFSINDFWIDLRISCVIGGFFKNLNLKTT